MNRIAVFLPNWIGDVVMATPALRAMRDQFPSAEIVGIMRPYVADVIAGNARSHREHSSHQKETPNRPLHRRTLGR